MDYTKTNWKDRVVEHPRRYKDQNDNVYTLTPEPGEITEEGTPVTAQRLNNIEDELKKVSDVSRELVDIQRKIRLGGLINI